MPQRSTFQPRVSKHLQAMRIAAAGYLLLASAPAHAHGQFEIFDVPTAAGTLAFDINNNDEIVGQWIDANNLTHGFRRDANGSLTTFDFPGAAETVSFQINKAGTIVGYFNHDDGLDHGFVLDSNGNGQAFDGPGNPLSTQAFCINNKDEAAGFYIDGSHIVHGFFRDSAGALTPFDPPGSTETLPADISGKGTVTGAYNSTFAPAGRALKALPPGGPTTFHGFVRLKDGTIEEFDPAGSASTRPTAITKEKVNGKGEEAVAGFYFDGGNVAHGFVRFADGTIETFDPPGSAGTMPTSIDAKGVVTGSFNDGNNTSHGFLREEDGTITTFDPSGSRLTGPRGINKKGLIVGGYSDGKFHGFLREP